VNAVTLAQLRRPRRRVVAFGLILVAALAAAVLLVGCGNSGGPAAYIGAGRTEAVYIQWQESSSGHLTGTITDDQLTGTPPDEAVSTNSASFAGDVSGGAVSITASGFLGITATLTGTLSGSTLILQVPASDGTIQTASFGQTDASAFNADVRVLHRAAARQRSSARPAGRSPAKGREPAS
jgi:hypothetical protein